MHFKPIIKVAGIHMLITTLPYLDIRCENLPTPANGEITSCTSGRVGVGYKLDTCSFTCNTGYELTGSSEKHVRVMVVGVDHQCPVSSWSVPHHHYQ